MRFQQLQSDLEFSECVSMLGVELFIERYLVFRLLTFMDHFRMKITHLGTVMVNQNLYITQQQIVAVSDENKCQSINHLSYLF